MKKLFLYGLAPGLCLYIILQILLYDKLHMIFDFSNLNNTTSYCSLLLSYIFGVLYLSTAFYLFYLFIKKNKIIGFYSKYFLIYFSVLFILLLLTWPGIFKGDEFYVIRNVLEFRFSPAQTGLTSLFYMACLLMFPSMATICFVQITFISCIFSYIVGGLFRLYKSKKVYFIIIPFFLLPVLDGNLFTLRSTLVGWLFLLLLFTIYFSYMSCSSCTSTILKESNISNKVLLVMGVLSGLLIAWRSEYIYLIVCLPLVLFLLHMISVKRSLILGFAIIICFMTINIPNKVALNGSNKYPISLVIGPLGNLFNLEHLDGPSVYDDIVTLDELIDVQLLRSHPSVRNISQYWNIDDVLPEETLQRFMTSACRLIFYNFDHFLYFKSLTFLHTNGFYPNEVNHPGGEDVLGITNLTYYGTDYKNQFILVKPIFSQNTRQKTIEFLACRTYEPGNCKTGIPLFLFYNCVPSMILLFILTLFAIIKRNPLFVFLSLLTSVQLILIFLTAPAMFFMYYYCFYLCSYVLCFLFFIEYSSNKKKQSI